MSDPLAAAIERLNGMLHNGFLQTVIVDDLRLVLTAHDAELREAFKAGWDAYREQDLERTGPSDPHPMDYHRALEKWKAAQNDK